MTTHAQPTLFSGGLPSVGELGYDDAELGRWLSEDPARLGLGSLTTADEEPAQDDHGSPAFLAADEDRYFSGDSDSASSTPRTASGCATAGHGTASATPIARTSPCS